MRLSPFVCCVIGWVLFAVACHAEAHPLVEGSADVVIAGDRLRIDARIPLEEISVAANGSADASNAKAHGEYLLKHFRVEVDGNEAAGSATYLPGSGVTANYRIEYALKAPPAVVRLRQDLLIDHDPWTASLVLRIRQDNQDTFQTALLLRGQTAEFGCQWPATSQPAIAPTAARTDLPIGKTFRAYFAHGVMHILTGYDHLLFVSALVLAATSLWDLVKVVTAFTLAHTLTLTLSVLNVVRLSEHVVEPMISASIVIVALQNVFWPRSSRGNLRLAAAFGFGLFHGLGFAGGLMEAMASMPARALWVALVAFSVGVEAGHQVVVLPLLGVLAAARGRRKEPSGGYARAIRASSAVISLAGVYFLVEALR